MTAIKIPLSIDQRASECLEEYGTYHRWPDMRLNDRCLIGYILKTIQDTLPTARVHVEWTAEDLSSLEVWVTTHNLDDPKWYWKIEPRASVDTGCRYSIEVVSTEWDTLTYIGTVDRLTTLLAVLCSGVDFFFVPGAEVPDTIMLMRAEGAGIIRGLNVQQVQETATETYNKVSGVRDLQSYIHSISGAIGSGGALNGKPSLIANGRSGNLIFHIELRLYDIAIERPRSLGTADNIIAALIVAYGGVEYTGEIVSTFPQEGDGLDVHALEEAAAEAYLAASYDGNCLPICDYIADTFRGMGYGAVVNHGLDCHVMVREVGGSKIRRYEITPLNKHYGVIAFDVDYLIDEVLYLGQVTTVTAAIAIVCTCLSFRGKES